MTLTKQCRLCHRVQPLEAFHAHTHRKDGHDNRCKMCKKEAAAKAREDNYFVEYAKTKKGECKSKGITYNLDAQYLEELWTGKCAITDTIIQYGKHGSGSHHKDQAHLDRYDPEAGYTKGNVDWVSGRINRIKYNATVEELSAILNYLLQERKK